MFCDPLIVVLIAISRIFMVNLGKNNVLVVLVVPGGVEAFCHQSPPCGGNGARAQFHKHKYCMQILQLL